MAKEMLGQDVYKTAMERMLELYESENRIVVSFSGGKDSGVVAELAILAAKQTGKLPVEMVMMDEEILYPGTFEYALRMAERKEVEFHWMVGNHPNINSFCRESPYYWAFDPKQEGKWVREPPAFATHIDLSELYQLANIVLFPPPEGAFLVSVLGLRVAESPMRAKGLYSSKGYITQVDMSGQKGGGRLARPIYDWKDEDVWKAYDEFGWDYNRAYDTLFRMGVKKRNLRIAPPFMKVSGLKTLQAAAKAWPYWFERCHERLPGVRAAVNYGKKAFAPYRFKGETWQQCFQRTCVRDAPAWIAERALEYAQKTQELHRKHSAMEFPDVWPCRVCRHGSWRQLTRKLYDGDPFSMATDLPYVEPGFFDPGRTSLYAWTKEIRKEANRRYGKGKLGRNITKSD